MKQSLSFIRGTTVGALFSLAVLIAIPAFAEQSDTRIQGPRFNPEHHQEMMEAFENGDFKAWEALIEESGRAPKILDAITEENFETFAQMHELMKEGNHEEAKALAEELGIKPPMSKGMKGRGPRGFGGEMHGGDMFKGQNSPCDNGPMADLSEEERKTFREEMQSCKDSGEWEDVRQCHKDIMDKYKEQ